MYRMQRKTSKGRKDNQKTRDKNCGRTRKREGNPDMSQRLTIPHDFYHNGIEPTSSQRTPNGTKISKDYNVEKCRGIFDECPNIRRSERLLKRNFSQNQFNGNCTEDNTNQKLCNASEEDFQKVFNKYLNLNSYKPVDVLVPNEPLKEEEEAPPKRPFKRTKSIFDEINELYNQPSKKPKLADGPPTGPPSDRAFVESVRRRLAGHYAPGRKALLTCKSKIFTELNRIEEILSGKAAMEEPAREQQRADFYEDHSEEADDSNWRYFSKFEWVFETPPTQKIVPPKLEDNQLQPAVIYSTRKHTQVFELDRNDKETLIEFEGRQNVLIDKRAKHVYPSMQVDSDKEPCSSKTFTNCSQIVSNEKVFNFSQPQQETFLNAFAKSSRNNYMEESKDACGGGAIKAKRKLENVLSQDLFVNKAMPERRYAKNKATFDRRQVDEETTGEFTLIEAGRLCSEKNLEFDFRNAPGDNRVYTEFGFP
ncbi:unnamed protein product [Phyllotreta striolata]|uniref:Uncharacterized protein n=1 Tax=Phyllotreta striolata TaxID=444603 RepID=A0A9N9T922_PHYSR|nr:unnamed protein product [Phyllotreta striolata]